jgi:hypothetical protein
MKDERRKELERLVKAKPHPLEKRLNIKRSKPKAKK